METNIMNKDTNLIQEYLQNINIKPWNQNVDHWRKIDAKQAMENINNFFNKYNGLYEVYQ
jgi:hypothetical protein